MSLTALVFAGISAVLAAALWRRPQAITLLLAGFFAMGALAAQTLPAANRPVSVIVLDLCLVLAMVHLVRRHRSSRALVVAWIGAAKIAFEIVAVITGLHQPIRAATINSAFVVQVLVAGDMLNGILAWLGYRLRGARARLPRMLGRV